MKKLYAKKEECCGCGACLDICSKDAIRMVVDREGFRYPKIDKNLCIDCGSRGMAVGNNDRQQRQDVRKCVL